MARWNPSDYAAHSSAQEAWARELIGRLSLEGNEHVLDIGSGDGRVTALLAAMVPRGRVVGVDNSAEMTAHARTTHPANRHPNLSFETKDAGGLTFEGEFDVVFSNACLHWIVDHRPVLRGIARSLRPAGRILLQMGGRGNAAGILAVFDVMMREREWRGYFADFVFPYGFHGPEEYTEWLFEAGFDAIDVRLVPKDMIHDSPAGLAGWIRTTWLPYVERVPEAERERFIGEIVARYLNSHLPDDMGRTHVGMVRLEAAAEKYA